MLRKKEGTKRPEQWEVFCGRVSNTPKSLATRGNPAPEQKKQIRKKKQKKQRENNEDKQQQREDPTS